MVDEITFVRSIWSKDNLIAGVPPLDKDKNKLGDPIKKEGGEDRVLDSISRAEYAFRPDEEFFFETMGESQEMFVVGFAFRGGDYFKSLRENDMIYDIYACYRERVDERSLVSVIKNLGGQGQDGTPRQETRKMFEETPTVEQISLDQPANVRVREDTISEKQIVEDILTGYDGTDLTEFGQDSDSNLRCQEKKKLAAVAILWEQYRHNVDFEPLGASLEKIDFFKSVVKKALKNRGPHPSIKYVSKLKDNAHSGEFTVVGEGADNPDNLSFASPYKQLKQFYEENGKLTWNALPSYETELHSQIKNRSAQLGVNPAQAIEEYKNRDEVNHEAGEFLARQVRENQTVPFYEDLWREFRRVYLDVVNELEPKLERQANAQFREIVDPERPKEEDDGGLLGSISSSSKSLLKTGKSGPDDLEKVVTKIATNSDTIETEEAREVAEQLVVENQELIEQIVEKHVTEQLTEEVKFHLQSRVRDITREVLTNSDEVRQTVAYEQADDDETWPE